METNAPYDSMRGEADALRVVAELQTLLESDKDHSFVVERAIERFSNLSDVEHAPSIEDYSRWLTPLGESLRSSICRQLEVEGYFNRQSWFNAISEVVDWPEAGDRVGAFLLIEQVGKGAHSRVFLCRQAGVGDRQVIVKFTRNSLLEADLLGRLRHPNIVPIYSASSDPQTKLAHICMPFVGRSTLCELIEFDAKRDAHVRDLLSSVANAGRRPTDAVEGSDAAPVRPRFYDHHDCVAWVGWRLALALAHAHEQGVVHGDVKPSNVLLSWDGTPLLMDFNLSGSLSHSVEAKGGTLPYMPPEQLQAVGLEFADAAYDQRSDLFSLGILLYEALSGRLPFPLSTAPGDRRSLAIELLKQQREGFVPLQTLDATIPPKLAAAVERCIAFDPLERYQSAGALADVLGAAFTTGGRLRSAAKYHRRPLIVGSIALGALIAGAGAVYASRPPEDVRLFDAGVAMMQEGRLDDAQIAFDRSLTLRADAPDVRFALGLALLRSGDISRAQACFSEVYQQRQSGLAMAYVAYCDCKRKRYSGGIPTGELAIEQEADCPEVMNNLALAYQFGEGRLAPKVKLQAAQTYLLRAKAKLPDSPSVRYNELSLRLSLADTAATSIAQADAEAAIRLAKEFPLDQKLQVDAARLLCLRAPLDHAMVAEAIECLERAVEQGYRLSAEQPTWRRLHSSPRFAELTIKSQAAEPMPKRPSKRLVERAIEPASLLPVNLR
jgi:serine/threonine protein kinase